ncbi:MAG: hypothetical protein ABI551_09500, partial [Polyangiaceae bacterium]
MVDGRWSMVDGRWSKLWTPGWLNKLIRHSD